MNEGFGAGWGYAISDENLKRLKNHLERFARRKGSAGNLYFCCLNVRESYVLLKVDFFMTERLKLM